MISPLNDAATLAVENALSGSQLSLQKSLTQLSTGCRINSGSDDAAGLSIVSGMQGNIAALTQSSQNAVNGIGLLQTADGALSQVTALLSRAITLATEAANGGLTSGNNSESEALDTEYQAILQEINQIGSSTDFNGANVFDSDGPTVFKSSHLVLTNAAVLAPGSITTISDWFTGGNFVYKAANGATVGDLDQAIALAAASGTLSSGTAGQIINGRWQIATDTPNDSIQVTSTVAGAFISDSALDKDAVFMSDGTDASDADSEICSTVDSISALALGLERTSLGSSSSAVQTLQALNLAISKVASQRGLVGASVNRLTTAVAVANLEVQNLTNASSGIRDANMGQVVADAAKYSITQSTATFAFSQATLSQRAILRLLS